MTRLDYYDKTTLIVAIRRATSYPYSSPQCELDHIDFLKNLQSNLGNIFYKDYIQKNIAFGFYKGLENRKEASIKFLFSSDIIFSLKKKWQTFFFLHVLSQPIPFWMDIFNYIQQKRPEILKDKKIKKRLTNAFIEACYCRKIKAINFFFEGSYCDSLNSKKIARALTTSDISQSFFKSNNLHLVDNFFSAAPQLLASHSIQKKLVLNLYRAIKYKRIEKLSCILNLNFYNKLDKKWQIFLFYLILNSYQDLFFPALEYFQDKYPNLIQARKFRHKLVKVNFQAFREAKRNLLRYFVDQNIYRYLSRGDLKLIFKRAKISSFIFCESNLFFLDYLSQFDPRLFNQKFLQKKIVLGLCEAIAFSKIKSLKAITSSKFFQLLKPQWQMLFFQMSLKEQNPLFFDILQYSVSSQPELFQKPQLQQYILKACKNAVDKNELAKLKPILNEALLKRAPHESQKDLQT